MEIPNPMKFIIYLCLLCIAGEIKSSAQNYSCVSAENKTWFTSSRGYLRGMRMDSVRIVDGNTVHYPFPTARTKYFAWAAEADTTGGSWWGKKVIETPNGDTWFINQNNDSLYVKNSAVTGDSWVFFRDTSNIYYRAEMIGMDTQTLNTSLDSVKVIRLNAFDENNNMVNDSINGIELRLSKHHGWATAIDFYLFPYRLAPGEWTGDCYFFEASGGTTTPGRDKLTFNYIDFVVPDSFQMFNYDIGQVFHVGRSTIWPGYNDHSILSKIRITGKTITPSAINYTYDYWRKTTTYPEAAAPYTSYDSGFAQSLVITNALLMDTAYMPEQWYSGKDHGAYYYYLPNDSSFCRNSLRYAVLTDVIINNRFGGGGPEPSFPEWHYKAGMGEIIYNNNNGQPETQSIWSSVEATGTIDDLCNDNNGVVSVKEFGHEDIQAKLYPVPADDVLYIEGPANLALTVSLFDILGKKVRSGSAAQGQQIALDLSAIPAGIYFARISSNGHAITRKIIIVHQ